MGKIKLFLVLVISLVWSGSAYAEKNNTNIISTIIKLIQSYPTTSTKEFYYYFYAYSNSGKIYYGWLKPVEKNGNQVVFGNEVQITDLLDDKNSSSCYLKSYQTNFSRQNTLA